MNNLRYLKNNFSFNALMQNKLTTLNHDREVAGLKYIYPVLSRRAGGLSIGINVNTNNACNWHCVYCQVPDLKRGAAPIVEWDLLHEELSGFLWQVQHGDFYDQFSIPIEQRKIKDIAISGNGEPTSAQPFDRLTRLIGEVIQDANILEQPKFVLISNGSLMHQNHVQDGLKCLAHFQGQVWYKLDRATDQGRLLINHAVMPAARQLENLIQCARLCPTWLQTCLVQFNDEIWSDDDCQAYLQFLTSTLNEVELQGVMLYSLARPSLQLEASRVTSYPLSAMRSLADEIMQLGLNVKVTQ